MIYPLGPLGQNHMHALLTERFKKSEELGFFIVIYHIYCVDRGNIFQIQKKN